MSKICTTCGLPEELCVCEIIAKESQKITIYLAKQKFGKKYTIVAGIDTKDIDIKAVAKKLKSRLACGGTSKEGTIELQGDHRQKVREFLVELGFAPETIEIVEKGR
jgi:translation initiation factor 1